MHNLIKEYIIKGFILDDGLEKAGTAYEVSQDATIRKFRIVQTDRTAAR